MNQKPESYPFIIDQHKIETLLKMVNEVVRDPNIWLDLTYNPKRNESEEESPPSLEIAEMLWGKDIRQVIVLKDAKYEAQLME
jgi:hypothetical protein